VAAILALNELFFHRIKCIFLMRIIYKYSFLQKILFSFQLPFQVTNDDLEKVKIKAVNPNDIPVYLSHY